MCQSLEVCIFFHSSTGTNDIPGPDCVPDTMNRVVTLTPHLK